jgi:hypothetical protein
MSIKKLLINYAQQTATAIIKLQKEIEKERSLGDSYLRDTHRFIEIFGHTAFERKNSMVQNLVSFLKTNYQQQQSEPVKINAENHLQHLSGNFSGYSYLWLYQDAVYGITGSYAEDEQKLLILEFADGERKKFERLKQKFSGKPTEEIKYDRIRIPEEVRIEVWRRDQGRCVRCGSRENLEYDHIVPISKGGSNTARNIELLCQNCNRSKGNKIE